MADTLPPQAGESGAAAASASKKPKTTKPRRCNTASAPRDTAAILQDIATPAQAAASLMRDELLRELRADDLRKAIADHEKKAKDNLDTLWIYEPPSRAAGARAKWLAYRWQAAEHDYWAELKRDELRALGYAVESTPLLAFGDPGRFTRALGRRGAA